MAFLFQQEKNPLLKQAKRVAIVRQLARLRCTDPNPPMMSTLDLEPVSCMGKVRLYYCQLISLTLWNPYYHLWL